MGCEKLKFQNCFFFVSSCLCGKKPQSVATGSATPNKFLYRYDPIDNRTKSKSSPPSVLLSYTSNNLNQYTKIKSSEPSGISEPTYDEFGNMTQCSLGFQPEISWSFSWNLHNRLVSAKSADTRLTSTYDPNGRRVTKKVYKKSPTGSWSLITDHRFLYSGFKCVAEIDALKNKVIQTYSWVGEQILDRYNPENKKSLFYVSDGNKNVLGLLNKKGEFKAKYTYDPYGKIIAKSGSEADNNPFRFSSEYADQETGLVYYNYRYYSPELGRWLSREPIGENGNLNLYGYGPNSPANGYDMLGLEWQVIWQTSTTRLSNVAPTTSEKNTRWVKGGMVGNKKEWVFEKRVAKFNWQTGKKLSDCMVIMFIGHNSYVESILNEEHENYAEPQACTRMGMLGCFSGPNAPEPKGHKIHKFPNPHGLIGWSKDATNAGYPSFDALINAAKSRAIAQAKRMAEDCKCECKRITVFVQCQQNEAGDGALNKLWEKYSGICDKPIKTFKCKKRKKP